MGLQRLHVQVEGRVQGVGYRMFVRDLAYQYKVSGWVRNRSDGSVEAEIEGERDVVASVVEAMHARNSYIIRVERMTTSPISPMEIQGFEIR